jgi:hypothetical protein
MYIYTRHTRGVNPGGYASLLEIFIMRKFEMN